jgi:hypothetical protein
MVEVPGRSAMARPPGVQYCGAARPPGGAGEVSPAYRPSAGPAAQINDDGRHHEPVDGQLVDSSTVRADVIGGVDVRSGMRSECDVQHVVAVDADGGRRSESRNRITRKHLGVRIDRHRQIDDPHGSGIPRRRAFQAPGPTIGR